MMSLDGVPLFAHSVATVLGSKKIDHVVVSSDSEEILEQAREHGAVALRRPTELCGNNIPNFAVCQNVVETLMNSGTLVDQVILLQPTHPFRTSQGLDEAIDRFAEHREFDSLASVKKVHRLLGEVTGNAWSTSHQQRGERAQARMNAYEMTGHLFILNVYRTIMQNTLLGNRVFAWPLPETWFDIDIDTRFDFVLAESVMSSGYHRAGAME